jgi:hypothetical protein
LHGQYTPIASNSPIHGYVDDVGYDPSVNYIDVRARPRRLFMHTKSSERFANQAASQSQTCSPARPDARRTATVTKASDLPENRPYQLANEQSERELRAGPAIGLDATMFEPERPFDPKAYDLLVAVA